MRPPTPDLPDEGEHLMAQYIAEAGDPHVEPSPEHVAHLREQLFARLNQPAIPATPPSRWRRTRRFVIGTGLTATSVLLALWILGRSGVAWAQVAKALQARPWVHGKVQGPDGKQIVEQWFSSNRELGGERAGSEISFHDYKRKVMTKYVEGDRAIYRLPEPPEGNSGEVNFLRQVLDLLRDPEGPARFPFPGLELIGEARREVSEKGKKLFEIELTLRVAGGSREKPVSMWIRVDPTTKLPDSFSMLADDGKRYTASIDYPEQGPADIYGLGAPRTAKMVDRSLPEEVMRVMAELKAGRREFGDYSAIVVEERLLPTNYLPKTMVYRVQRKGQKWRIDDLRPGRLEWAPPADADKAWWDEHHAEFKFIPRVISDGKVYWNYSFRDEWKPGVPTPKPGKPNAIGQTVGPNQFSGPGDDPVLPFWCQDLLPEYAGHPSAGLWEPAGDREFLVETQADGGPPDTILFRGRDSISPAGQIADHFRLWLDPAADHLSMRTEIRIHDRNDITKVAYIDSHVVEAREKSPKGRWYPLQVRHIAHNGQHELVRKFFVDFEAKLPDELFQPLE